MLTFNPLERPSAEQLLQEPIFDLIRVESLETQSIYLNDKVEMDFDERIELPTNLEHFRRECLKKDQTTLDKYRLLIVEEYQKLHNFK